MSKQPAKPAEKQSAAAKVNAKAAAQSAKAKGQALAAKLKPPALATPIVASNVVLMILSILSMAGLIFYIETTERRDIMMAYTASGQLGQLQYSDTPNTSSEALINWSKMVVGDVFTYNFNDIYQRMDASFGYFTKRGWESFAAAFMQSDVFNRTQSQRIFVSTLPSGVASVIEEGDVKGHYTWTVQLGAVTRIYSGSTQLENNTITMVVEKVPTINSITGYPFGIVKISR